MGRNWWRNRGPWIATITGVIAVLLLLLLTGMPLGRKDGLPNAADTGQLTGLLIAAGGAVVAMVFWAWRATRSTGASVAPTPAELAQVKQRLAGLVAQQWKAEATLRSLDDPDPIPVRWELTDQAGVMDHPANIEDCSAGGSWWGVSSADIAGLAARFRATRRRRLVIVGGPGMGKTTLAVQLVRHLLDTRTDAEPVPVLLSMAGWDTEAFPRLHDWLVDRLLRDYPALRSAELGGAPMVTALAARSHLLPVLDGLDELPVPARSAMITALNRSLSNTDQLILTSRTEEFTTAVTSAADVLTSAIVLQPQPVEPAAAADHLKRCLPPAPGPVWEEILNGLKQSAVDGFSGTDQASTSSAVAQIAATPLGLWLVRTVYISPRADPTPLTDPRRFPTTAALRSHLLDQLIPALITTRPPSRDPAEPFRPRRTHDPVNVHRWLGYLAHHLAHPRNPDKTPRTRDFAWWYLARHVIAEHRTPKLAAALTFGLTFAVTYGLPFVLTGWHLAGLEAGLEAGLAAGLMAWRGLSAWSRDAPGFADLRLRGRARQLTGPLARGLMVGLPAGLMVRLLVRDGLTTGVTVGVTVGLTVGLLEWIQAPVQAESASTPSSSWRADRTLTLIRTIAAGLAAGPTVGLVGGHALAPMLPTFALAVALAVGLTFAFTVGLGEGNHRAWVAYVIAIRFLAHRRLLPRDLLAFLEDAHRLGLLRTVGPVYQFRHAELQDHLADDYEQSLTAI